MPFKSKSQRRWMYAAEARGEVPKGTAKKWEEHTPKDKELPEKVAEELYDPKLKQMVSVITSKPGETHKEYAKRYQESLPKVAEDLLLKAAALTSNIVRHGPAKIAPSLTSNTLGSFRQAPKVQTSLGNFSQRQQAHSGNIHKAFKSNTIAGKQTSTKIPSTGKTTVKLSSAAIMDGTHNLVPGGAGKSKSVHDFDPEEIRIGRLVEREHFKNSGHDDAWIEARATEITLDHLAEDPHYYTKKQHDFREEARKAKAGTEKSGSAWPLIAAAAALGAGGYGLYRALKKPEKATLGRSIKTPHKRMINQAIKDGKGDYNVEYEKADGTVVTRRVRPLSAKGPVVIVHDYERDGVRSFRTDRLRKFEKASSAMLKQAGGPGSGVKGDNTLRIGLPQSPHVSVGTRKALLDNMPFYEDTVNMSDITAVGQEKYVPEKLNRMMDNPDILSNPIHLLKVTNPKTGSVEYHVIDGHHRYLVARKRGVNKIRAKIYEKRTDELEKDAGIKDFASRMGKTVPYKQV